MLKGKNVNIRPLSRDDLGWFTNWNNGPDYKGPFEPHEFLSRDQIEKWFKSDKNAEWWVIEDKKGKLSEIEGILGNLQKDLSKHNDAMEQFSKKALKLDFQTFVNKELELELENLESLQLLDKELEKFADEIESDAHLCKKALEFFEELESEEESKTKGKVASEESTEEEATEAFAIARTEHNTQGISVNYEGLELKRYKR